MKYIIYGVNRVAKDFLYIFDSLEIVYFIDTDSDRTDFLGYPVHDIAYALNNQGYDQIIICDFDKEQKKKRLLAEGLEYGKDFVCEQDFFAKLDDFQIPEGRKTAVWGTGLTAKKLAGYNIQWNTCCYIDTYKSTERFNGLPVMAPDEITDWKEYFIIIAVAKDKEITAYLRERNLTEITDYVHCQQMTGLPSALLCRTIFDTAYYDLECNTMLNNMEIFYRGNTRCCCTTFVDQDLDNMMNKDVDELWHSKRHKILCLSTENRTYSFCDKTMCPLFVAKNSSQPQITDRSYKNMTNRPEVLAVGYDSSCNLKCVTCRKQLYIAQEKELEELNRITEIIREKYLPACKFLILAGDGEVFASRTYQSVYEDAGCNPDFIRILSNGTLFTKERWKTFIRGKSGRIMLTVSIDAASKETYEQIRCNGDFNQLQKNMEFAARLRREGALSYFRINFVVQKKNYHEMIPFVQWGEKLGVDEVFFTKILNWGTYTDEEFQQISMMEADGITPKKELKEVLENPIMRQSAIADLGTIQYCHKADPAEKIDNYYMWELEKRGGKIFEQ